MATKFRQKISQNCTKFPAQIASFTVETSLVTHQTCFRLTLVPFCGRRFQTCYLKFQGSEGNCHGNQIWATINKIAPISVLRKISKTFTPIVRFSGSANSNMLSEISRKPRELPWQPNLDKNKPKWHKFQICVKNQGIFRMYGKVYRVGEFKYAT